jgi:hypothetical protein
MTKEKWRDVCAIVVHTFFHVVVSKQRLNQLDTALARGDVVRKEFCCHFFCMLKINKENRLWWLLCRAGWEKQYFVKSCSCFHPSLKSNILQISLPIHHDYGPYFIPDSALEIGGLDGMLAEPASWLVQVVCPSLVLSVQDIRSIRVYKFCVYKLRVQAIEIHNIDSQSLSAKLIKR